MTTRELPNVSTIRARDRVYSVSTLCKVSNEINTAPLVRPGNRSSTRHDDCNHAVLSRYRAAAGPIVFGFGNDPEAKYFYVQAVSEAGVIAATDWDAA